MQSAWRATRRLVSDGRLFSSAPFTKTPDVGIFVDAENMSHFLKNKGAERLIDTASEFGRPIVRKAFGNWSHGSVNAHQDSLIANGFQLIHTPHPVSGKGSADLALVVDVMATVERMPNLECYVLATGDSDFSHLFWHLRQCGRRVVGVGPESPLSQIVKNSADKFIYTDAPRGPAHAAIPAAAKPSPGHEASSEQAARDHGFALLRRAIRMLVRTTDSTRFNPGRIKEAMIQLDSAFDERRLGFERFLSFLRVSDQIVAVTTGLHGTAYVEVKSSAAAATTKSTTLTEATLTEASSLLLRRALSVVEDGCNASELKSNLLLLDSTFDQRCLGFKKFTDFLRASKIVTIDVGRAHFSSEDAVDLFNDDDDDDAATIGDATLLLLRSALDSYSQQQREMSCELLGTNTDEDGAYSVAGIRHAVLELDSSFDARHLGFPGFFSLLRASKLVTMHATPKGLRVYYPRLPDAA